MPTIGGPDISTPTHPVRIRHEDDDIIAEPYHTPIPGQPEVPIRPAANNIAPAAQPSTPGTPPTSAAAPILRQTARSIDPDSTYVGASAEDQAAAAESDRNSPGLLRRPNQHSNFRSSPTHEAYPTVSSGLMAGNLISAPLPSYPALAKFTHLSGRNLQRRHRFGHPRPERSPPVTRSSRRRRPPLALPPLRRRRPPRRRCHHRYGRLPQPRLTRSTRPSSYPIEMP